jgi:mannosyltransferase
VSAGTILHEVPRRTRRVQDDAEPVISPGAIAALAALIALAAGLRLWGVAHQGFWFDEANTALLVHLSPGKMLGLIPQSESTPPLYYCVAWVWARLFGYTEGPLRALSALAGVATVPIVYLAGAKLLSRRAGLVAAALAACNPLLVWYSQEARSYALLVMLTSLSLLGFAYARAEPTAGRVAGWVIAAALALATHYYALLAVVPEALWLLAAYGRRPAIRVGVGLVALCGLALVPLALSQNGTGHAGWIGTVPLGRRLSQVVPQFLTGFALPAGSILLPLAGALAALGIVLAFALSDPPARRRAAGLAALALGGLGLELILVAAGIDDLITRNLLALWVPAALVLAAGLAARRSGMAGILAAAALCGIGVSGAVAVQRNRDYQRPDWRGVARVLGAEPAAAPGGRVILVQHYRDLLPLSLYLPGLRFLPPAGARVRELDVVSFTSPPSGGFCWWGSACNLWPSVMQASYPVPGFHAVWRRDVYQFTVLRLLADQPRLVTRNEVGRGLRATRLRNDELLLQP